MIDFLLVDDDLAFRQVLERALQRKGYTTITAANVVEAIKLAEQHSFSKAVVDLKMDGASGLTLIPQLKQRQPAVAIVILTGYSSVTTAVEAVKLGALNYLCKPANTQQILAAFEETEGDADVAIAETRLSVDRLEWEHIQQVLNENNGNISATARALGMHRRTLQRKLNKRPVRE